MSNDYNKKLHEQAHAYRTEMHPEGEATRIIDWTKNWFQENGPKASAVIGISGGKDSTIAAAILAKALGPERVIGVLLPDNGQSDINDSYSVIRHLGIRGIQSDIGKAVQALRSCLYDAMDPLTGRRIWLNVGKNAQINTPPRIRMAALYAIAADIEGGAMVCNTCNLSEEYIGYSTKYGDAAGDFAPLAQYTVMETLLIGESATLKLPRGLVYKTPSDGLCGLSDEERFGFTYAELDRYIRTGHCDNQAVKARIDAMHAASAHKRRLIPCCPYKEAAA